MMLRLQLDSELIRHLYVDEKDSCKEIAKKLGVNRYTIYKRINLMGIKEKRDRLKLDNDLIKSLYVNKKESKAAIAQNLGVSDWTIDKRLQDSGIKIRPSSEANRIISGKIFDDDMPKIIELYENGNTLDEIAVMYGVTRALISKYLRRLNKTRTPEESKIIRGTTFSGERNPQWRGGKYKDPDGYIRVLNYNHHRANSHGYVLEHIAVWEEYHKKQLPKGYLIHHLNGIRSDNRPQNLLAMKNSEHIHQTEPFKKRIRELEIENRQLKRALEDSQSIFYINDN
jgi:hypothetical protein